MAPQEAERAERARLALGAREGSPRIYRFPKNYIGFLDFNWDFLGFPILLLGFPRISIRILS